MDLTIWNAHITNIREISAVLSTYSHCPSHHLTRIQLLFGSKPKGSNWIDKTNYNPDGSKRFKVWLVRQDFQLISGIDFDKTYVPMSNLTTLHLILSLTGQYNWVIGHRNVVTAFQNPKIGRDYTYKTPPFRMEWIDLRIKTKMVVWLL